METSSGNAHNRLQNRNDMSSRPKSSCCSGCNSQICFSYVLSIIASALIVGGVYLAYHQWDKMWLIFSATGILLIFIGSCLYYCGNINIYKHEEHSSGSRSRRRRRCRNRNLSNDQLMPTAPPLSESRSISQFSLNMIPQYFAAIDSESLASNVTSTPSVSTAKTFSQIFSLNGQSYLILPLNGESLPSTDNYPMQNIVVKMNDSESNSRKTSICELTKMQKTRSVKTPLHEEQACQTEDHLPKHDMIIDRSIDNSCRDVQLQTHPNDFLENATPVDRTINLPENPLLSSVSLRRNRVAGIDMREAESIATSSNSHEGSSLLLLNIERENNCTSVENDYNESESPVVYNDAGAVEMPFIDLREENNLESTNCNASCATALESNDPPDSIILNEARICDGDIVIEECFGFSNDNLNEEEIENNRSTPPPSYEEIFIDEHNDNDDDNEEDEMHVSILNYGTL